MAKAVQLLPELSWLGREAVNLAVGSPSLPGSVFAEASVELQRPVRVRCIRITGLRH